jgi:LacI family transcriptional regulator
MRFVNRAHLDGVIMLPPVSDIDELAESLDKAGCRFVRIMSVLSEEPWKQVVTDYLPGITEMTSHLVELGHREFAFISGPRTNISSQMRRDMFVQALAKYDFEISPEMIIEGAFTFQSGIDAARKLLFLEHRPTAIFAANDEMAFGVMNVAAEMGLKIPEDLSLVGFDGTSFSTFVVPSLTTIVRQTDVMSRLGTQKLLARINEGPDAAEEFDTMVPTRFIARESTGPAPPNNGNNGVRVK